jgi:TPR repeat protein
VTGIQASAGAVRGASPERRAVRAMPAWLAIISCFAALAAMPLSWIAMPGRAVAVEPYFCIELVLSRNWPAARFYCDAASTPDNIGIKLAEGIAYFFGAQNPSDVGRASRLWREVPPIADESEWRNISGVFDPEIDSIERSAANLDRLAQYKLGVLHETGHFETPDLAAAFFRYEQAAGANLPEAHIALARLYQRGVESIGVEADPVKAEQHLMKAIALRTPSQRQMPAEPSVEVPAIAVAEAEVTIEPTQVNDDDVSGVYEPEPAEVVETVDEPETEIAALEQTVPQVEPLDEVDVAAVSLATETGSVAGTAVRASSSTVQSSAPALTPTGTLPSDRNTASDVELSPEVVAALLEAAANASVLAGSAGASASAQLTSATAGAAEVADPDPATGSAPAEQLSNVEIVTIVPSEPVSTRPVPTDGAEIEVEPEGASIAADSQGQTIVPSEAGEPETAVPTGVTSAGDGDETADGNGKWTPPADVAALYYPRESLQGQTPPPDAGTADGTTQASASAAASRLETTELLDDYAQSCASSASGATLAMPVVPDEDDALDGESPASASHVVDPGALAAIEQGIRAKSAGDIEGALAAWRPYGSKGNATAQYLIGLVYLTGEAIPRNLRTAYAWLSLAAAQGHQLAGCELYRLNQRMSADDAALARQEAEAILASP